jgi:hypothetical protein
MIEWMFQILSFLASNTGLLLTGAVCGLVILLWDWRFGLLGVCFIQLSAATAGVVLHGMAAEWAMIQSVVVVLVCLMLLLSARAHGLRPSIRQPGTGVARGLLLGMFLAGAWFMEVQIALPGMDALVMELFVWLVLCAVMLLGLSDHPLYNGIGLLLWLIPVQVIVAVVTPIPVVVALVGLVVLVVGMAVSYLVYVEHLAAEERDLVLTDLAFPQQVRLEGAPSRESAGPKKKWFERELPTQRTHTGTDAPRAAERGQQLTARREP